MINSIAIKPKRRWPALSYFWPSVTEPGMEHATLVRCGLALLFTFILLVFIPDPVWALGRFIINPLAALWIGLALIKTRSRLRFTFPYFVLLVLQVWMVVSMLHSETYVSKMEVTGEYLWFPLEVGVPYVLATVLFGLMPGVARYVINFFLLLCSLSAFMAILQAAHVGPAVRVADFYVYRSIEGWDNVEGIRASGLTNNPNNSVMGLIIGACLIAYKSAQRRLRWFDWALWAMFIMAAFAAQHRSSMPIIAVTFVATALVMARHRPRVQFLLFGSAALGLLMAMTVGKHVFSYTFETDWNNAPQLEGRIYEEKTAYATYLQYPYFGIGPAPAPEAYTRGTSNKFDYKIENLYAAILLTLGAPGFALLATIYVSALVLSIVYYLNKRLHYAARVMAMCGAVGAFALIFNGNVQVNITQFHVMFLYMILMALVQYAVKPPLSRPRRIRVSPYLQASDKGRSSNTLASIN